MAISRVLHGVLRFVACGSHAAVDGSFDEEVVIEIDLGDEDVESIPEEPQTPRRLDSLERGYQSVMNRALTFAHKWSQPDLRNELLSPSRPSTDETDDTDDADDAEMQGDCEPLVVRDSSQARFEQLMQRTSRFYQRCSMLQRNPQLLD